METLRSNITNIALINNDCEKVRQLGISLVNIGYHVSHFSSAVSALQDKNIDSFKLFLVDMELPQMDGLSFYKALKSYYDEELPFVIAIIPLCLTNEKILIFHHYLCVKRDIYCTGIPLINPYYNPATN